MKNVALMLCIPEKSDKDQECAVHAVFSLIFPLPKRRCLVCLCRACQRLLHWSKLPYFSLIWSQDCLMALKKYHNPLNQMS